LATTLDIVVIGLQAGAIYSLVALGIALVYRATRVLNFAHGEIGTTAAFAAFVVIVGGNSGAGRAEGGAGLWVGSLVAIGAGVLLAIAVNALIGRLRHATAATHLVATVAVALLLLAFQVGVFEIRARPFPRYIEGAPCLERDPAGECVRELVIGTVVVPWHTIVILGVLAVASGGLALLFRTRMGMALLATAQDPFAAELQGVSARAMTNLAWGIAGGLAALAGLLGAGVFAQISPGLVLTTFLIPGFVAAVLGGMTSMLGAVIGGLILGVTASAGNQIVQSYGLDIPGPPQAAALAVLLLVLLIRPQGLLGKELR
jgi:branched-chain amino acid transport system permease protein